MTQSGVSRAGIGIGWMVVTGILLVAVLLFLMMLSGLLWNVECGNGLVSPGLHSQCFT